MRFLISIIWFLWKLGRLLHYFYWGRPLGSLFFHRKRSGWLRAPTDIKNWRTQLQPIRTIGEIITHIKILPVQRPYLYQKLSKKATQLRLLEMSYGEIAESLHINIKTATKACEYQRR